MDSVLVRARTAARHWCHVDPALAPLRTAPRKAHGARRPEPVQRRASGCVLRYRPAGRDRGGLGPPAAGPVRIPARVALRQSRGSPGGARSGARPLLHAAGRSGTDASALSRDPGSGSRPGLARHRAGIPTRAATRPTLRGVLLYASEYATPADRLRGDVPGHDRWGECASAGGREGCLGAQRSRCDPGPQPPFRGRRAKPRRRTNYDASAGRSGAGGHTGAGPLGDRRWALYVIC